MTDFRIAHIPVGTKNYEQNKLYYYIYDKDETDKTHYGTCDFTIRVCSYYKAKTKKSAEKKLKYYQSL